MVPQIARVSVIHKLKRSNRTRFDQIYDLCWSLGIANDQCWRICEFLTLVEDLSRKSLTHLKFVSYRLFILLDI